MTSATVSIEKLMTASGVQFGTSGARGLVTAMTDQVCYAYTVAFLQHLRDSGQLKTNSDIALAGDLRPSSPRIMKAIGAAIVEQGFNIINCGAIPSPAVANFGLARNIPSIMVTGSHIPDDRNGIKFNKCEGEILKEDEAGIRAQSIAINPQRFNDNGFFKPDEEIELPVEQTCAHDIYVERYTSFFGKLCLSGKKIGLYQHSTVGREIFRTILENLGATVICLGYSDIFIPVDTEAVRQEDIDLARQWARDDAYDMLISADGDADRPLISDEYGKWLRGDVAGILCARYLGADVVVTPVSSNSAVEKSGYFKAVRRTQIGSPFVIAAMQKALADNPSANIVGYEANGGFLTGSDINISHSTLAPLPTRDAILVPLAILMLGNKENKTVSQLIADLPQRFTASNRIKEFPAELSKTRLKELKNNTMIEDIFGNHFGEVENVDTTDGLRITFTNDEVVHLRPSGNAPEFRCYNEAATEKRAIEMNKICMEILSGWKD